MKSLDKKKPSELFEGVNSSLHKSFVEAVERDKKKNKQIESWQVDKQSQERQDKVGLEFANKCVEKFKPKELDWEKVAFLFHNTYEGLAPKFGYETRKDTKAFDTKSQNGQLMIATCKAVVSHLLTQQRTELLEEIKTRVDTWGGFEDDGGNLCHYDSEILEWLEEIKNYEKL